jgi:hypothetical protein
MAGRARRTLLLLGVLAVVALVLRRRRGAPDDLEDAAWPRLADVAVAPGPEHSPVRSPDPWVLPSDGACPATHPVKAKVTSGIFHPPGSAHYDRTRPDRCYRDETAAEADGMRAPKR